MKRDEQLLRTLDHRLADLAGGPEGKTFSLPPSLLRKIAGRLRVLSTVVIVLILVSWIGVNLIEGELAGEFETPYQWAPNVVGLLASVLVLALLRSRRLSPSRIVTLGLVYQVAISYSIPLAEDWRTFTSLNPHFFNSDLIGLSGVAPWMLFFTVLVPSRPRNALIALILSASAVPVTVGFLIWIGDAPAVPPLPFFFTFVFPYIVCVVLAFLAARIIYGLGRDVGRAQELGSYHLTGLIGRGGMGEVWRAHHAMLARPAAIKLVRRDSLGSDPQAVQTILARFEREAQVTAALQSPHTVALYDFGTSDDGLLYYVMELLDGIDLESLVERHGPLVPERVVHILRQACHSLAEAHRQGLIHRDIKPSNILLCEHAFETDFVKILDFGLVKYAAEIGAGVDLTKAGMGEIAGTPSYIAPEIALGKREIDGRADIYGLGCVAYWMLTGRRVFEAESAMAMIMAHVNKAPEPPSALAELPIPEDLERLVLACLAKEPGERPATATALRQMLEQIDLKTPWTSERASSWWQTHRPHQTHAPSDSR